MDPMLFCLPERILDDGEESNLVSRHYRPRFPVDRSAPQEELETLRLPEPSLQTSQERSHLVKDELASKRPSTDAKIPQKRTNSDQRTDDLSLTQRDSNQQPVQRPVPSLTCPIEQIPDQDSQLSLQALPPGAMSQPILMPLLPEEPMVAPCWLSPVTSTPNLSCGLSPCVLVPISSPVLMCCPYLPPGSVVLLPEIHPPCLCPQSVRPIHQPCAPDPVRRRAAQQVSEQLRSESVLSGKEQTEEQVKSEEKKQKNTPGKNKLQATNTNGKRTKPKVSPASLPCLDEETLAERAFEEYMTIMDSLTLKIPEGVEAKENEEDKDEERTKWETENGSFLEHLEELCSDEDFVRKVGSTLNIQYLESLLSADPEPIDLLALEKQDQGMMLQEHQPPTGTSIDPLTEEKSLAGSKLYSLLSSDPEPADLLLLRELQQEPLETLLLQHSQPPSANTNSIIPVTEETSPATLCDQAPIQRAELPILGPHGAQSDTNPNHNGQNAHLSMRNDGSEEGWTSRAPLNSLPYLEDAVSPLNHSRSPFTDYSLSSTLELLADIFSDTQLTSDLEARDNRLVPEPALTYPTEDVSEEASKSLSKLADTQSAQTPQKLQDVPLPRNPPASKAPATSSAERSYVNPHAITVKDPAPSFRADLLTISPPQLASSPALIALASSTAQISEPEEQCCPKNRSSCLEGFKVPVQANSSSMAISNAESCGPPLDGNLSDLELEKQTVEPPKLMQASQEFTSSGVSSGGWAEMDRKCEKKLEEGVEATKQTAIKARERGRPKKTPEGRRQNKENEKKLRGTKNKVQLRRSQRLSGQNETDKARQSSEFIMERAKETNIKNTAKVIPERDGLTYEKQRRWSSGGRQLSKEESHFKESSQATKTANTAEQFYMTGQHLNGSTENGVEINPDVQELSEGRVKRNKEVIQTSSSERTRTMTMEEKVQPTPLPATRAREKIKHSVMERGEIKSSPKREMQRGNKQENASEQLLVSGQVSNEDKVFRDQSPASPPESSLQSPRVQTPTHSPKDLKDDQCRQTPCEGRLNETICEKNVPLRLVLCPETQQQHKKDASSRDGVKRTETWVFYNLRSRTHEPNVSNRLGVQENKATHHPSNKDKVSGDHGPVSLPTSSLQSPSVQPQTLSTKDFLKDDQSRQESPEELLHERQKSPSVKSGEKNPDLSPALCPETQQQHKKVASSRDGVTKTWNFYSLRSRTLEPDVSKGTVNRTGVQENKATEATHRPSTEDKVSEDINPIGVRPSSPHSSRIQRDTGFQENKARHETSNPKPNRDQTAGVKDDSEAERPSLTSSPVKRCRHEYREASEKRETRVDEDKMISFSPMKRGRWKKKLTWNEKGQDEVPENLETPGCKLSPPLTRSSRKARDKKTSTLLAGQKTFGGDRRRVIETRSRVRKGASIPCSRKFPSKCKDFILYKTNRHK